MALKMVDVEKVVGKILTQSMAETKVETEVEVSPVIEPEVPVKVFVEPPATEVEALTTEFVRLHTKFAAMEGKEMVKRMEEIRKQLQLIANETMDPAKPAIFKCPEGELEFSERGQATDIPNPSKLVFDMMNKFGPEVADTVVDIALGNLRKLLTEFELLKYLKKVPGARTLRAVRPSND